MRLHPIFFLVIFSVCNSQQGIGAENRPLSDSVPSSADEEEISAEEAALPPEKRGELKFQQSKLTNDRSEMEADRREVRLSVGLDKIIDLNFDPIVTEKGISIGNPGVVGVDPVKIGAKRQIVLKAKKAGDTTVTVRDQGGFVRLILRVTVSGGDLVATARDLKDLLGEIEGIKISERGKKVVIDGEVIIPADYGRILNVISDPMYKDLVLNLVTFSQLALDVLARKIGTDVQSFAPNVKTRVVNQQIWLEGAVDNEDLRKRASDVAALYLPEKFPGDPLEKDPMLRKGSQRDLVKNWIVVNPPPPKRDAKMVRVTLHFVELSKDYNKLFGFKWQPGFTADPQVNIGTDQQGAAGATAVNFSATLSALFPKLQSAQAAGFARIIKTATVTVKSGQKGFVSNETRIPILTAGPQGTTQAAAQQVGFAIEITPQVVGSSEDVAMDVDVSQADLVGRSGNQPITAKNVVKTKLFIKSNESAAIAGFNTTEVSTQFNRDDPASANFQGAQTSPLFTAIRSKNFSKKKGQFVVFLTPSIVEDAAEGTQDLQRNFRIKVR